METIVYRNEDFSGIVHRQRGRCWLAVRSAPGMCKDKKGVKGAWAKDLLMIMSPARLQLFWVVSHIMWSNFSRLKSEPSHSQTSFHLGFGNVTWVFQQSDYPGITWPQLRRQEIESWCSTWVKGPRTLEEWWQTFWCPFLDVLGAKWPWHWCFGQNGLHDMVGPCFWLLGFRVWLSGPPRSPVIYPIPLNKFLPKLVRMEVALGN